MIAFVVFIGGIGLSMKERQKLSIPESVIMDSVGTLQQFLYRPASYITEFFVNMANLRQVYEENAQLRKTAAAYARDKNRFAIIDQQNTRLQEALHFTERQKNMYDYRYLIAQVVAVSNDPLNPTIRINLGSQDGIKTNMAVVTVDGLVGLVSRVDRYYSNVMPFTQLDERSTASKAISATAQGRESTSFGVIENYDEVSGFLSMNKINQDDPLSVGDTIISSGLGEVFPQGIVIGKVVSRQVGDFGLTHTAKIEPAADLDHLTEVFVIEVR